MKIYRLSKLGYSLSRSTDNPHTPEWLCIHFLARNHSASRDKLLAEIPGLTTTILLKLRMRNIVVEEGGVEV